MATPTRTDFGPLPASRERGAPRRRFLRQLALAGLGGLVGMEVVERRPRSARGALSQGQPPVRLISLASATVADFDPLVGDTFRLAPEGGRGLSLTLLVARAHAIDPRRPPELLRRRSFSLLFRLPGGALLPQDVYGIEHAATGPLRLLLVPVGRCEDGLRLEAVLG